LANIGQPLESQPSKENPLLVLLYFLLQSSFNFCVLWCYTLQPAAFHRFSVEFVTGFTTICIHAIKVTLSLTQVAAQSGCGSQLIQLLSVVHVSILAWL
jgi:hypothetical protein